MVKKIIRAQDILKEKEFSFPPFNTNAFTDAIVSFFRGNDVSAKLSLIPLRFVELENTPSDGFAVATKIFDGKYENDYVYVFPKFIPWEEWWLDRNYAYFPIIFINEVYMENAVALLKMLGFIVGRLHKWKSFKCRNITLV